MADTSIEWTDATWNPVAGCSLASPGCTNCYAMRMAARLEAMGSEKYLGLTRKSGGRAVWTGHIYLDHTALQVPYSWKKPRMVFVNSMSDLFHENVPESFVSDVWRVMANTPHTFQILTKRPARMAEVVAALPTLKNVWLGTSVESSRYVSRLDDLRRVKAVVRFVSFEPLLGPIHSPDLTGISWAIVGGESGPRARPIKEAWVREIHAACRGAETAFFFKQWGGKNKASTGRKLDGQTWDEYPASSSA